MIPWSTALAAVIVVGYIAWHWGRAAAPRDPHALRVLLGQEPPQTTSTEREQVAALQEALVNAGWVHVNYVRDPDHFDKAGRYLWWGC